jgi:hypothetical protein
MKKIFTLIAAGALTIGISYAQRTVDIETILVSPSSGSNVNSTTAFDMTFTVTNNGPDSIKAGDSIVFLQGINNTYYPNTTKIITSTDTLAPGASKNYTATGLYITGGNSQTLNACALVVLIQRTGVDTVRDNTAGGNNYACNSVNYVNPASIGSELSANKMSSMSYPNPASSNLTVAFTAQQGDATLNIVDVTGKLVISENFLANDGLTERNINVEALKPGVYFYELILNGMVDRHKFVVNR